MNWGMDHWVSYSFYRPASPQTKSKSMKKHWSRTTVSTSREQTAITYNSLGALQPNKDFRALLARLYPVFNRWPLPSPRTRWVKKWTDFFQNTQLFTQCISMLYTEKSVLRYYVQFSQIRSHKTKKCVNCTKIFYFAQYICFSKVDISNLILEMEGQNMWKRLPNIHEW